MGLVMHRIFVEIYTSDVTVLRRIKKHAQSTQSTSDLSVRHPAPTKSSSLSDDPTNMHNFQVKYPKIHDLKRKMIFSKLWSICSNRQDLYKHPRQRLDPKICPESPVISPHKVLFITFLSDICFNPRTKWNGHYHTREDSIWIKLGTWFAMGQVEPPKVARPWWDLGAISREAVMQHDNMSEALRERQIIASREHSR